MRYTAILAALSLLLVACGSTRATADIPPTPRVAPTSTDAPRPVQATPTPPRPVQVGSFIMLSADSAPIRFGPSESSDLVATGRKGDVFERVSDSGDWVEIKMFSGEWRYVRRSQTAIVSYQSSNGLSLDRRKALYRAMLAAEDRADTDASAKIPARQVKENIVLNRILNDRYKLDAMRSFGLQPPEYRSIVIEGVSSGW